METIFRGLWDGGSGHWMLATVEAGSIPGNNKRFEKLKRSLNIYKSCTIKHKSTDAF